MNEITSEQIKNYMDTLASQIQAENHRPSGMIIPAGVVIYAESKGITFEQMQEWAFSSPIKIVELLENWSSDKLKQREAK